MCACCRLSSSQPVVDESSAVSGRLANSQLYVCPQSDDSETKRLKIMDDKRERDAEHRPIGRNEGGRQ